MNTILRRAGAIIAVAALGLAAAGQPARAWWHGGVWVGVGGPLVVAPPVAYAPPPPPGYYPYYPYYPPYAYAPPPAPSAVPQPTPQPAPQSQAQTPVAYAAMCYAGVYTCAAAPGTPVGATCACDGIGAPSYGTAQ